MVLSLAATPPPTRRDAIEPDAAIQREIARVAAAGSAQELKAPLARLRQAGGRNHAALMPQLVLFSMRAMDVRGGMAPAVVIRELGISREAQLEGLAPYLGATDPRLARELRNYLGNLDDASAAHPPDFGHYQPLLRQRGAEASAVLVQYMLETAPEQGLRTLAEVYGGDAARRAALQSAAASRSGADLERLAADEAWWARLYVAERLRQDPSLRTPALLERLRVDPNPLVRQAVTEQ